MQKKEWDPISMTHTPFFYFLFLFFIFFVFLFSVYDFSVLFIFMDYVFLISPKRVFAERRRLCSDSILDVVIITLNFGAFHYSIEE